MMASTPPAPRRPEPEECCGQGCHTCVLDTYSKELEIWQRECSRLASSSVLSVSRFLSPDVYSEFKLVSVSRETAECSVYTFGSDYSLDCLAPGKHMICQGRLSGNETVFREYTPISWSHDEFQVLIKHYPDGLLSTIVQKWQPGDLVDWRGPVGDFQLKRAKGIVLMFAMGTGVAPMIPIITAIVEEENEKEERIAKLFLGVKNLEAVPLKKKLQELARFWNFSCSLCLSEPTNSSAPAYLGIENEKIDADFLTKELGKFDPKLTTVMACGTRIFEQQLKDRATELGFDDFVTF